LGRTDNGFYAGGKRQGTLIHALVQSRVHNFGRLVHSGPCRINIQVERNKTKSSVGFAVFFDGSTGWLHVGCWPIGALTHFIFSIEAYIVAMFSLSRSSCGRPRNAPALSSPFVCLLFHSGHRVALIPMGFLL
jgi:hypothetical protein